MILADIKHDILDILFQRFLAQRQACQIARGQVVKSALPALLNQTFAVHRGNDNISGRSRP